MYNESYMQIQSNIPLKDFSTMRLGGNARHLGVIKTKDELIQAVTWAQSQQLPLFVLGGGSNVVVRDSGFNGLVIVNQLEGFDITDESESYVTLKIGAGENWDSVVERTVEMGLTGIEAMSYIPGTTGATPVQNVGAYGQEIADTLVEIEAYDLVTLGFARIGRQECNFSYRNSAFKSTENRRYIIASLTLRLKKGNPSPPFYESLQKYFEKNNIDTSRVTPAEVRKAVIAIRTEKLPDPSVVANTGSFFKNPIVTRDTFDKIQSSHENMPHFIMPDGRVKLMAGWLIERSGLKGYSAHGFRTYENNALVVINDHSSAFEDLEAFKGEIIAKVQQSFGVTLEQEPELL